MAKRFTDTEIWKRQRWFRKLSPIYKLAFFYIKDQCDHAGVWAIDCSDLMEDLGIGEFDLDEFIRAINDEYDKFTGKRVTKERLRLIDGKYLLITSFIQYQYEGKERKLSQTSHVVNSALLVLDGLGVLDTLIAENNITLRQPLDKGYLTVKVKDKVKDKDKEPINNIIQGKNEKIENASFDLFYREIKKQRDTMNDLLRMDIAKEMADKYSGKQIHDVTSLVQTWLNNRK